MINIAGIPKSRVLLALFNASFQQGMGKNDPRGARPLTEADAEEYCANFVRFDYLHGRVLKVDLSGDLLDPRLYDRNVGEGAAWRALEAAGLVMKPATIITILTDGTKLVQQHDPTKRPSLKLLQKEVGGLIQPVDQYLKGKEAYINEEGILLGLQINLEGSKAVRWPVGEKDVLGNEIGPLHGPVVILEGFVPEEDELTEEDEANGYEQDLQGERDEAEVAEMERRLNRPPDYPDLSPREQWEIDKRLGILDEP
jgi:hypothetical protein